MNRIFDLDNGFFRFMGKVWDMIFLNLLTLVGCIPLITIGPSLTAMYYVAMKTVRDEEGYVFKSFVKSFKQNFVQGVILELIMVAAGAILYIDLKVAYNWMNEGGMWIRLLFYALVGLALAAVVTAVYVFPILAKFENSVKKILLNSLMMSVRHLQMSVLMIVIIAAAVAAVYIYPIALFFVIGLAAYLNAVILRKIFDNYVKVDSEGRTITDTGEEEQVEETQAESYTVNEDNE